MANYSYAQITIKKNKQQNETLALDNMQLFINDINSITTENNWLDPVSYQKDDSVDQRAKYSTGEILTFEYNENKPEIINMAVQGRWCTPSQLFIDLCKKYKLSLHYIDREGGCNFTHVVIMEEGKVKLNKQNEYTSSLSIKYCEDEVYEEIIQEFQDSDYDQNTLGLKEFFKSEDGNHYKFALTSAGHYRIFLKYYKNYY